MRQALGPGALGRPRGSGWRGRWEGGSGWGTHVNPWLLHFNVWQNSLQIKKKKKLFPLRLWNSMYKWKVCFFLVSLLPSCLTVPKDITPFVVLSQGGWFLSHVPGTTWPEQDKCSPCFLLLIPNHCPTFLHKSIQIWNSTLDSIISPFPWATSYWPSITSPHSWLPVTFSITMLIISLTISISYLAESSSTLAFQLLDLFSKHLILYLMSAIDFHGHTHMILSLLRILFPSES